MADSILRLRLETGEFDNSVRQAVNGMLSMEKEARKMGASLINAAGETREDVRANMEFINSIGQMETRSKTAAGQVSELSKAFLDLSAMYSRMSDEEKKGAVGQALNQQLEILKNRAQGAKTELDGFNAELSGQDGLFGSLDGVLSKFGLSTKALLGWGTALAAAKGAVTVLKDALLSNEVVFDTWQGYIQSSEAVYDLFLNTLNTGDLSMFLDNIDEVIDKAREAYDALDALGTYNAFNQLNETKSRATFEQKLADYRTGDATKAEVTEAARVLKDTLTEREKLEQGAFDAAVAELAAKFAVPADMLKDVLTGSYADYMAAKNVQQTGERVVSQANWWGMNTSYIQKYSANDQERLGVLLRSLNDSGADGANETQNLESIMKLAGASYETARARASIDRQMARVMTGKSPDEREAERLQKEAERQAKAAAAASAARDGGKDKELTLSQQISALEKEALTATEDRRKEIAATIQGLDAELELQKNIVKELHGQTEPQQQDRRVMSQKNIDAKKSEIKAQLPTTEIGSDLYNKLTAQLSDANTFSQLIEHAVNKGIDLVDVDATGLYQKIFNADAGDYVSADMWQDIVDTINDKIEEVSGEIEPIKLSIDAKTGNVSVAVEKSDKLADNTKKISEYANAAGSAISNVGEAFMQLDDEGAQVAGMVMKAVGSVAMAAGQAMVQAAANPATSGLVWVGTAASIAGTMISTIKSIHNITGYALGGEIKGGSVSGDNIPIMANAGEVVLTRAMQGNLATQLEGAQASRAPRNSIITGEQIVTAVNAYGRRTGRGEILR